MTDDHRRADDRLLGKIEEHMDNDLRWKEAFEKRYTKDLDALDKRLIPLEADLNERLGTAKFVIAVSTISGMIGACLTWAFGPHK
jgi:hypothetical protein